MRGKNELIKRYIFFFFGIGFNAVGVALMTKSMLGTGPTACIPYVASLAFPLTFGTFTFIFNVILLLAQIIILRKRFPLFQLLQIPITLVYSAFLDGAMDMLSDIKADYYLVSIIVLVTGCVIRALGVSCQVVADVVMLPTEAFIKAITDVMHKEFSVVKLIGDAVMTLAAVLLSLYFIGTVEGVREGTFITVMLVGPISHVFTKNLRFTNHYFENEGRFVYEKQFKIQEGKRVVITVTSESGSGGRVIARILGVKLNLPVYDKELVGMVAKAGQFTTEYVRKHNERLYSSTLEAFIMENYAIVDDSMERYRSLFEAQKQVIEEIAKKEDCIIVGHCANYILGNMEGSLHIHICSDNRHRITYMMDKYNVSRKRAREMVERQDSDIYNYTLHFTGKNWKDASNYNLTVDSTVFGYEGTAEIIEQVVKKNYMDMPTAKVSEVIRKYNLEDSLGYKGN